MSSDMSKENWEQLRTVDIRQMDKCNLVDLNSVTIDETLPIPERIESFVRQIKNPYCFRVGDVAVKVQYSANGPSFQQNMEDLFRTM